MSLIQLIRTNTVNSVEFSEQYDPNWDDETIANNIVKLDCSGQGLIELPDLPNCTHLNCGIKAVPTNRYTAASGETFPYPKCRHLTLTVN